MPALPADASVPLELCPVRTLRLYITVSDSHRSRNQSKLLISHVRGFGRDITSQTFSNYVKRPICEAHRLAASLPDTAVAPDLGVTAHQVRHMATSLAQLSSLPLPEVIKAGGWTTPPTYLRHYLQFLPQP